MKILSLVALIFLLLPFDLYPQDEIIYVSPGISISWDLNGNFIVSPKVSFGFLRDDVFYNITLGRTASSSDKTASYYFAETQFGILSNPMEFRRVQFFSGGGIGVNYHPNNQENTFSFRASAFIGYCAFLKATVITKDSINADFGLEAVLPIPLNFKFGSIGG